jgi:hypothetical protein
MAKVLRNFKKTGKYLEEFPMIKLIDSELVMADLPICAVDFDREYVNPVVRYMQNVPFALVEEAAEMQQSIKGTKVFHFDFTEDAIHLKEVAPEAAKIHQRLPLDTPVKEMVFINGQLLRERPAGTPPPNTPPVEDEKPNA